MQKISIRNRSNGEDFAVTRKLKNKSWRKSNEQTNYFKSKDQEDVQRLIMRSEPFDMGSYSVSYISHYYTPNRQQVRLL